MGTACSSRICPAFRPSSSSSSCVSCAASFGSVSRSTAPLSMMARWNEPLGAGHRHQRGDFSSAARLSEDRDQIRIAAEAVDVVTHPLQRRDDVEHADVAGEREVRARRLGQVGEAEHVQPVIDAHDDHVVGVRQAGAVVDAATSPSRWKNRRRAARPSPGASVRRPTPGVNTFSTRQSSLSTGRSGARRSIAQALRRGRSVGERIARTGPGRGLGRRHEAVLAGRRARHTECP